MSGVLPIQERFVSVQGEGLLVGTPSSFVRVTGCNLRCVWCDSPATSWSPAGAATPLDDLVRFCADGPEHVVLTGGEPLLFPAIARLSQRLSQSHHITVETAGTTWLDDLECDLMSISPKLRHSTPWQRNGRWGLRHEQRRWRPQIVSRLMTTYAWQLKFVVRAQTDRELSEDLEEVEQLLAVLRLGENDRSRVLLMPECVDPARLVGDYERLRPACEQRKLGLGERRHIELFGHTPGT